MIGLVNSAGAASASREQAAQSTREVIATPRDLGDPPMWVRPHETASPTRETVKSVAPTAPQEQPATTGASADARAQAAVTADSGNTQHGVGQSLDVVA
jgi:hypothetical protein